MGKKLQLTIAEPCHENWEGMTPVEKGKFCGSCQKQVVDFSDMSDRQVAEFFKKPSTGSVCGRFMTDQLDREIIVPRKRIPWVKYFFQFALPAFLMSMRASAQNPKAKLKSDVVNSDTARKPVSDAYKMMGMVARPVNLKPFTGDTIVKATKEPVEAINEDVKMDTDTTGVEPSCSPFIMGAIAMTVQLNKNEIEGIVVDENNQPVAFASIETGKPGEMIMADENGYFKMKESWLAKGKRIAVSSTGFEKREIKAGGENYTAGKLRIALKSNIVLEEVVVTAYETIRCKTITGSVSYVKGETIAVNPKTETVVSKTIPLPADENRLLVYPNPVVRGTTLNISFKKTEEGYYQLLLLNQSGQVVDQKELWIDGEARVLDIRVPVLSAGSYFLVMTNKKTGNKFTEKVIIQ